jgi:hypothetical protein
MEEIEENPSPILQNENENEMGAEPVPEQVLEQEVVPPPPTLLSLFNNAQVIDLNTVQEASNPTTAAVKTDIAAKEADNPIEPYGELLLKWIKWQDVEVPLATLETGECFFSFLSFSILESLCVTPLKNDLLAGEFAVLRGLDPPRTDNSPASSLF